MALALLLVLASVVNAAETEPDFQKHVQPVLKQFCFDCHTQGSEEGGIALDALVSQADPPSRFEQWFAVWKNVRSGIMPPAEADHPSEEQRAVLLHWIEQDVFKLDPRHPDPGRVTIRRLNREEYRNTIQDMLGVEFNTVEAFPADDTGYGFDTIGDVLSLSPLLMEKYLEAAQAIVAEAVPTGGPKIPQVTLSADQFRGENRGSEGRRRSGRYLSFADAATVEHKWPIEHSGPYRIQAQMEVRGSEEATSNTATVVLHLDGAELQRKALGWDNSKSVTLSVDLALEPGEHNFALELIPGEPPKDGEGKLFVSLRNVELTGPLDGSHNVYPPQYRRIFVDGPPPDDAAGREEYARKILRRLADQAFRRPVDDRTLERLVQMAMRVDSRKGKRFEDGIAHALTAVLASPRFLFRAEIQPEPNDPGRIVRLDEYSLASRLSYFFWSSLPDEELFRLAREKRLRANLRQQVDRMLADPKGERFVRNFVGQWLQTRDIEGINVDARRILRIRDRDEAERIFNRNVRRAMRQETELLFAHLLRENGPVVDLLTADYTFLNESLANFYGVKGVQGDEMRKVSLSADDHRGGVLTQGSFLVITSNPTRTSPVKRGLFILDNILGTPAPPPPPNVPELDTGRRSSEQRLTMRQMMEVHREQPLCAACHARMDPLGLALESYNALGQYRETEAGQPIETAGQLMTGEKFANARELSQVLATSRRTDFYRCLTEKLLTYGIGRGIEYTDAPTVDKIVAGLEQDGGLRSLIHGIVESAPFQMRRGDGD